MLFCARHCIDRISYDFPFHRRFAVFIPSCTTQNRISPKKYQTIQRRVNAYNCVGPYVNEPDTFIVRWRF